MTFNSHHSDRSRCSWLNSIPLSAAFTTVLAAGVVQAADDKVPVQDEIVVSASRIPLPAREVGSAVTVITAEDLEEKQTRDITDAIREVPGIAVSRSGPTGALTQVRIRGTEANQVLVLIDGVEVNDPSGGSEFDLSNLSLAAVERIEILRGPQSALYGSDAIGGVISIVTKRGQGKPQADLSIEGGSFTTGQLNAGVRGGTDKVNYAFAASIFSTQGISVAPEANGNTEEDGSRKGSFDARLGFKLADNLKLDLTGRLLASNVETDPQPAVAGVITTVDGDTETNTFQRTGSARLSYSMLNGAWDHALTASYNSDDADSLTNGNVTFTANGAKTKFDYQSTYRFGTSAGAPARHSLTVLAERENEEQVTKSAFGNSDLDVTNYSVAAEYRVSLWDTLHLSGGVRHDITDIFKNSTTYRTTAAYVVDATGTRLHGSFGTGVKNPTLSELFGFGPNFVPNPNLKAESSIGWDFGIEQPLFDDRLVMDVTYFNNRITDLIQGAGNTAVNLAGTAQIHGVEVSADAEVMEGLNLTAQYTYTLAEDANGIQLIRRPKHTASLNTSYRFMDNKARIGLGIDYHGDQQDIQFSNFFATRTAITLQHYVLVNITGSYQVRDGVEIFGRVENALDQEYEDVFSFSNPGIGAFVGLRAKL